jgi:hypothetical protein
LEDGVMYPKSFLCACALIVCTSVAWGSDATQVSYSATSLGSGRWQYDYTIANMSLSPAVKEVTIRFDYGKYQSLEVAGTTPSGWNSIVWQPDPFLSDAGAFDTLSSSGVLPGNVVGGFSARFTWTGTGTPDAQWYEVVNPVTFATIDSGWTVPEPCTLAVLGLGSYVVVRRRRAA